LQVVIYVFFTLLLVLIRYNAFIVFGMCNVLIKYLGMKVWGGVKDRNMADKGEVALFCKNMY